nr:carbohydrate binding domain-containing protein [Ruminococcus sp.]
MNVDWWRFDGAGSSSSETDKAYIFKNTFEGRLDGVTDRCGASVALSSDEAYEGSGSAYVSERSSSWQGVGKSLNYKFKAGEKYSFSAIVKYNEGAPTTKFHLTLQYNDADDEANYVKIDTKNVAKGEWTQLSNTSFEIPAGAKSPLVYVETEGDSDDDDPATNFYLDNFFAAVDGTVIEGPQASAESAVTVWGDANVDGKVDMSDAVLVMQSVKDPDKYKLTAQGAYNADVFETGGGITADDADTIKKYLVNKIG